MKIILFHFSFFLKFLPVVFLFASAPAADAQKAKTHTITTDEAKSIKKDANTLFNSANYNSALKAYEELIKADPNNPEFNYRIGYCYLMTNVNKAKAVDYFMAACKEKNPRKETVYFFGLANMYAERWDDALKLFEDYKTTTHSRPVKDFPAVDRLIEMCNNAKVLSSHPLNVTFKNLGKTINSPTEDYNPFVSADGKTLVFTSRRKGNTGGFIAELGIFSADIYSSVWKDTAWTKAKSVGASINSEWDEESVGLSADGNYLLIYFDNTEAYSDIAFSTLKGKTWQKAELLGPPINTKTFETAASISLDGSTIYFASERKDIIGGSDIFMSKKKDNGDWGPAVNLGPVINTKEEEDAPYIAMDGKTLYFSSKGHNSMGGFDVFRSVYDESSNTWSEPVNIGYPVNNADDNLFFSMTGDQRHAYVSAVREGGFGDKDIYEITYNDTTDHPFLALISGTVVSSAGTKADILKATLAKKSDNTVIMTYKPAAAGNEFVFAARPGEYTVTVEGYNFQAYSEDVIIPNEFPLKDVVKKFSVKTGKQ